MEEKRLADSGDQPQSLRRETRGLPRSSSQANLTAQLEEQHARLNVNRIWYRGIWTSSGGGVTLRIQDDVAIELEAADYGLAAALEPGVSGEASARGLGDANLE